MKVRLSRTLTIMMLTTTAGLFAVLVLAYRAGSISGGRSILDFGLFPHEAAIMFVAAAAFAAVLSLALILVIRKRVVRPVQQVAQFSQKLASGEKNAVIKLTVEDEFNLIVQNFIRASAKVAASKLLPPEPRARSFISRRARL